MSALFSPLRSILAACALLLAVLIPSGGVRAQSAPEPLRVGIHHDNKPWEFVGPEGTYVGVDVDMVTAIAARLNRVPEWHALAFDALFHHLEAGDIDLVASSITVTAQRQQAYDFTQPYYVTAQAVVAERSSAFRDLANLAGQAVGVTRGSANIPWVEELKQRYHFASVRETDGLDEARDLLRTGEIAAYFGDAPALFYALLGDRNLAVIARLPSDERYALLLRKDSPLTEPVNAALTALKMDGEMERIHRKWFGTAAPPGSPMVTVTPRP